jgi:hypothetical protein
MTDGDLLYNGELTDSEPQTIAVYSNEWRSFLLSAVAILSSPDMWEPGTDLDAVGVQLEDLLARLMGGEVTGLVYAKNTLQLFYHQLTWVHHDDPVIQTLPSQVFNVAIYLTAPADGIDIAFVDLYLPAGTATIQLLGRSDPAAGISRWLLDGADLGAGQNMDQYTAAIQYNRQWDRLIVVPASGIHRLSLKNFGKNAASSHYHFIMTYAFIITHPE